jgi:hypothetical protein
MFQTEVVEEFKTHILCSINLLEYRAIYKIMGKNIVAVGGIYNNNAHAHCMLDT